MIIEDRRFLAVDQGNSLIKLTLFVGDSLSEECRLHPSASDEIIAKIEEWQPDCGVFCSVGRIDSRMVESMRIVLSGKLLIVSRSTPLPVGIDYSTPDTLGLDRVALACGAVSLCPGESVAVVDAGTAVTLDVVDEKGVFWGGRITAGLHLRFEALNHFTVALPLVDASGETPCIGRSTDAAIRSGVVLGLADEITETFRQYSIVAGCDRLLLTGGDAALLAPHIVGRAPLVAVPDLIARGLLYIYDYNEKRI